MEADDGVVTRVPLEGLGTTSINIMVDIEGDTSNNTSNHSSNNPNIHNHNRAAITKLLRVTLLHPIRNKLRDRALTNLSPFRSQHPEHHNSHKRNTWRLFKLLRPHRPTHNLASCQHLPHHNRAPC